MEVVGGPRCPHERLIVSFGSHCRREVPCVLVGSKVTEVQEALEAKRDPSCGAAGNGRTCQETQMFLNAMNVQSRAGAGMRLGARGQ